MEKKKLLGTNWKKNFHVFEHYGGYDSMSVCMKE
jgi:hypothetical protein